MLAEGFRKEMQSMHKRKKIIQINITVSKKTFFYKLQVNLIQENSQNQSEQGKN